MSTTPTHPSPDLAIVAGNKSRWSHAEHRRYGWHHLHQIARYGVSFRARNVMLLNKRVNLRMAQNEALQQLTSLPSFSAMVVIRGSDILCERYAPDFGKDSPHSIQSITKTMMNLLVGQLVERGTLDLSRRVDHYLPQIGTGYAHATLQQVLNMDVVNDYSADLMDPQATYYRYEEAIGWRLPRDPGQQETERGFLKGISSTDTTNRSGVIHYKDSNTAVLGWVVESASGRPLRAFLADIADAAGLEGTLFMTTDRDGVPAIGGGACLTARDLARYAAIVVRRGRGVNGESVGSSAFIDQTLSSGVSMSRPFEAYRYSNHFMVSGRLLGHMGWSGQYAVANLDTGTIGVFFSVIEDQDGADPDYFISVVRMLDALTALA
jgi:CubicO group peptidase (beta-lactamase class C family)